MRARLIIDPVNLTQETEQLLLQFLKKQNKDCRLSRNKNNYWVGFTRFRLAHDIVVRQKVPGVWRYYVLEDASSGNGKYGSFFKVLKRLRVDSGGEPHLVAKDGDCGYGYKKQLICSDNEYSLMQQCHHLRPRQLITGVPSLISMRYLKGETVVDLINNDIGKEKKRVLTLKERFKISIRFFRALQNQIHDNMIYHRDLKPDNLIYCFANGTATIFDLGASQLMANFLDTRSRGNSTFSAPEEFTSELTGRPVSVSEYNVNTPIFSQSDASSDIYSLALVVSLFWRNYDSVFEEKAGGPAQRMRERAQAGWATHLQLFYQLDDVDHHIKAEIEKLLRDMTLVDKGARPDLQTCLNRFEDIFLQYKLSMCESNDDLTLANQLALNCYTDLRRAKRASQLEKKIISTSAGLKFDNATTQLSDFVKYLKKKLSFKYGTLQLELTGYLQDYKVDGDGVIDDLLAELQDRGSIESFELCLRGAIDQLPDSKEALEEFLYTLDIKCLNKAESKEQLARLVEAIFDDYRKSLKMVGQLSELFGQPEIDQVRNEVGVDLDRYTKDKLLFDYFISSIRSRPLTLDDMVKMTLHCEKKFKTFNAYVEVLDGSKNDKGADKLLIM